MAKRAFAPFGTSAVDRLVAAFLERNGVNPKDIIGYRLTRSIDDLGTIEFSMPFEDEPEQKEG